MKKRVGICGILGKMGRCVYQAVSSEKTLCCVGGVDLKPSNELPVPVYQDIGKLIQECRPDVLVDFTISDAAFRNIKAALQQKVACVVGTTGLSEKELKALDRQAKKNHTPCFLAPNFSIGAVLMMQFASIASKFFPEAEIIEYHHNQKKDAPSGTAIRTAQLMHSKKDPENMDRPSRGELHHHIPVHSVRLQSLVAHQEVLFSKQGELLTIRHDSFDRTCFMEGVLLAIRKVDKLKKGLTIGLENLF